MEVRSAPRSSARSWRDPSPVSDLGRARALLPRLARGEDDPRPSRRQDSCAVSRARTRPTTVIHEAEEVTAAQDPQPADLGPAISPGKRDGTVRVIALVRAMIAPSVSRQPH